VIKNKATIINFRWIFLAGGLISILFSIVFYLNMPAENNDLIMLTGMFAGLGTAFISIGAYGFVMNARMTPEQKRQAEIDMKDERNQLINGKACKVACVVASVFFAVSAFVMVAFGNRTAAYLCIGGMYVQILTMMIAQLYYKRKL
jgi:uncharacterized membrane protein